LSGSSIFKPPPLPEAMTWKDERSSEIFVVMRKWKMYVRQGNNGPVIIFPRRGVWR
jgi:hypothetical protein